MVKAQYRVNGMGYRSVLRDYHTRQECLGVAQRLALDAQGRGGGPYRCDVIPGVNRAHARASTGNKNAFYKEGRLRALSRSIPRKGQMTSKQRAKNRERLDRYYRRKRNGG